MRSLTQWVQEHTSLGQQYAVPFPRPGLLVAGVFLCHKLAGGCRKDGTRAGFVCSFGGSVLLGQVRGCLNWPLPPCERGDPDQLELPGAGGVSHAEGLSAVASCPASSKSTHSPISDSPGG